MDAQQLEKKIVRWGVNPDVGDGTGGEVWFEIEVTEDEVTDEVFDAAAIAWMERQPKPFGKHKNTWHGGDVYRDLVPGRTVCFLMLDDGDDCE